MATIELSACLPNVGRVRRRPATGVLWPVGCMLGSVAVAAVLAGLLPIAFSIAIVFLFAGPHNWLEARYFMSRMPPRWGRLRSFFLLGIGGVLGLTGAMLTLPWAATAGGNRPETWSILIATWNTALAVWIGGLAALRARQNPRRDWPWLWPAVLVAVALAWIAPLSWSLALVYLHPLLSLVFLDAEIGRRRPDLQAASRACLAAIPLAVAALAWSLAGAADLPGRDVLTAQITAHAGAGIVPHVSTHFLVATHTFLEMVHYAIWCLALPLLTGHVPWRLDQVPLARGSSRWRAAISGVLVTGGLIVMLFWVGFVVDYPLTRSVYFTVAMLHVLAEIPFLVREL
jgi:hypothetical protein